LTDGTSKEPAATVQPT